MIEITTLEVAGISSALRAMRNPLDSWSRSDSYNDAFRNVCIVGDVDKDLSIRLQKAGPEHCKHLRMVMVWADINAPLYWWKEADTYRAGVEKVSCSTMHTITKRPFTREIFSDGVDAETVAELERLRLTYLLTDDADDKKQLWRQIIARLPSAFMQKRTVMFSYAALRSIYRQREGHKLEEWQAFREWCERLPKSWMITE